MVGTASLALLGLLPALGRAGIAPALYPKKLLNSADSRPTEAEGRFRFGLSGHSLIIFLIFP